MFQKTTIEKLLPIAIIATILSSCFKDTGTKTYKLYTPIYQTTQQVRASIKNDAPQPITSIGKMVLLGNYIFLNEPQKGIHIINNTNPERPINAAFITIPGNENLAIKDNMLYADCYTDLIAIDISNPQIVAPKGFVNNLFPERRYINGYYVDSGKVITSWSVRDTTVSLDIVEGQGIWTNGSYLTTTNYRGGIFFASALTSSAGVGVTGSTSKYAILNNYLYALTSFQLKSINITQADAPQLANSISINSIVETIFPFNNNLFIGTQTGMFIYGLSNPAIPQQLSQFTHARNCDPVIADGNYAYVTLHSNSNTTPSVVGCVGTLNELDIVDITNLSQTKLLKTYTLSRPYGLSKDGNLLFICDIKDGLKIFDATNPLNITTKQTLAIGETSDVIALNGIAYVVAKDGLYQYSYTNTNNVTLLSKIALN